MQVESKTVPAQDEREEFEVEYRREMDRHCPGVILPEFFARSALTGDYMFAPVQSAWCGWRRSRAVQTEQDDLLDEQHGQPMEVSDG